MGNGKIYIGTSGWHYKHWQGTFYPNEIPHSEHFSHYQKFFKTVELNATFYRLPKKEVFQHWKETVPHNFAFSVKASRYITHMKKLKDPAESIAKFMENVSALEDKLGTILFQLPPGWNVNIERFGEFLAKLPTGFRYTFEFRNHTWYDPKIYDLLRKFNCAFCIYDLEQQLSPMEITANFVYVRLHGPEGKYNGRYSDTALQQWADRIKGWSKDKDVMVYFDNDIGTNAPYDAQRLLHLTASEIN